MFVRSKMSDSIFRCTQSIGFNLSVLKKSAGLTLVEMLVVIGILLFLIMISGVLFVPRYIQRARDAQRKSDLSEYKIQFEAYNTDHKRYPPAEIMDSRDDCGSDNLSSYMPRILCDPLTNDPYLYQVSDDGQQYWLYTVLEDPTDPNITEIGCGGGCGPDTDADSIRDYNYGIGSGGLDGQELEFSYAPPSCGWGCYANQCSSCCPGKYRCNSAGTGCYPDPTCN